MTVKKQNSAPSTVAYCRLKGLYVGEIANQLKEELNLDNINEVPKLQKIILNIGLGRAKDDKRAIEVATNTLRKISGQHPIDTIAKKSIAGFKLREGNKIGIKVTIRGTRMYEFTDRIINVVIPRFRDFHGVSAKSFDKSGNYNIGISDQSAFPELSFEETTHLHGLQVIFVIKSKSIDHSKVLLEKFGLPFEKPPKDLSDKNNKEPK